MKQLETLYKRAKTGDIQFWKIQITEGIGHAHITKMSGKLGTNNPLIHEECITEGKNLGKANETTPHQQAHLQAESDWKKKKDEGYKSLKDLGIEACTVGDLVGQYMMTKTHGIYTYGLRYCLEETLPKFNTDANGNVKPMLAKTVDWRKVKYPCLVQPKLDGVRCLLIIGQKDDELYLEGSATFLSRSGKPYTTLNHIEQDVITFVKSFGDAVCDFILDGEIYSDELTFQEIVAAVKKERDFSKKLKFRVYDIVSEELQIDRWNQVQHLVNLIRSPHITFVDTHSACQQSDIKELHDKWFKEGYEGAMIRHTDGKYGQGQRSSDLLKVKEFDENEFYFLRFETGQREEDLIAVCAKIDSSDSVVQYDKTFRAKMQGNVAHRRALETAGIPVGTAITIKHFGWTDDGLPRFPIGKSFRDYE